MIACFFMTVKHIARIKLGGELTRTGQMVPVWVLADENPPFLEHLSGDQCCHSLSLTPLTDLRERCVTGNMSIYWIFLSSQESPCGCGVGECGLEQVIRISLFPPLEPAKSMGWRSQCTKCPIPFSVEVSAASLPPITATNKTPLGAVRRGLEQLGKPPSPLLNCMAWNQEDAESPLCSLPKFFMSVVEQRKPILLWLSLWYLQWWKLSLRLFLWLGYSKPSFVALLLHQKSWAYAI